MHLLTLFGERDGFMLGYSIVYPLFIMVCPSLSSLLLFSVFVCVLSLCISMHSYGIMRNKERVMGGI